MNNILFEDYEFLKEMLSSKLAPYQRVVILGCTGMLGFYITSIFALHYSNHPQTTGFSVLGVSRKKDAKIVSLEEGFPNTFKSITFNQLETEITSNIKTLVVHAASPSSFQSISNDPLGAIFTNIEITIKISNLLKNSGGHIVFLSSGELYGNCAPVPTGENDYSAIDHLSSRGAYPELKKAAEVILDAYCKSTNNLNATSLRVFHTFGPGISLNDPRIFGLVCQSIHTKKEIVLNSDGSTIRAFMYSRDLVSAILHTIGVEGFCAYNVAGKDPLSIADFCQLSISLGVPKIIFSNLSDEIPRNEQIGFANTEKLEALGWYPSVTTEEALKRTTDSIR
jgi:nucleoside-diphosphate-sugar epimerase